MFWKNPVQVWRQQAKRYSLLGRVGQVVTWSEVTAPPDSFADQGRYVIALIDYGDQKQLHQLVGVDSASIVKGLRVRAVLRRLYAQSEEGIICYGVKCTPLEESIGL